MGSELIVVRRHVRNLIGYSHPFLAEASDGNLYVVKPSFEQTGSNLLFNECAGHALYGACGLPVPGWKPILLTKQFLEENTGKWQSECPGCLALEPGLAFGSLFLGGSGIKLLEILPESSLSRIENRASFWLAWLIDLCGRHADNRQVVFQVRNSRRLRAVYIDHGHCLGGPGGDAKTHLWRCCYLDRRVYMPLQSEESTALFSVVRTLDADRIWGRVSLIPPEWSTASGVRAFADCLNLLADLKLIESLADSLKRAVIHGRDCEQIRHQTIRESATRVFRSGLPEIG